VPFFIFVIVELDPAILEMPETSPGITEWMYD